MSAVFCIVPLEFNSFYIVGTRKVHVPCSAEGHAFAADEKCIMSDAVCAGALEIISVEPRTSCITPNRTSKLSSKRLEKSYCCSMPIIRN